MPRNWSDLFWVSLTLVAGLVIVFAARNLFARPHKPRSVRWLPVIAGLALMLPGACAHVPAPPTAPTPEPVWDNADFAPNLQRT